MAFVVGQIESVKRRVVFELPADSGKKPEKADFVAELRYHDADTLKDRQKELQEIMAEANREIAKMREDSSYEPIIPDSNLSEKYLREDLMNLEGCMDEEGNEIEFSPGLVDAVLRDRPSRIALITTWEELNLNLPNAKKRKN